MDARQRGRLPPPGPAMRGPAAFPVVVKGGSRPGFVNLRDVWRHRGLIRLMAARDVKLRFRQTRFGATWLVINPLIFTVGYAFLFGGIGDVAIEGHSYFVFTFVGISLWGSFNHVFNRTCNCLLGNRDLLTHAYFPRLAVPLASVLATQVDVLISLALLAAFLVVDGADPTWALALVPLWFVAMQAIAAALGLLVASWTIAFRDLQNITSVVVAMGPIFTPVAYPVSALPEQAKVLAVLNPLTPLLDAMRASTLGSGWPSSGALAYGFAAVAVLVLAAGRVFARAERRLADVI